MPSLWHVQIFFLCHPKPVQAPVNWCSLNNNCLHAHEVRIILAVYQFTTWSSWAKSTQKPHFKLWRFLNSTWKYCLGQKFQPLWSFTKRKGQSEFVGTTWPACLTQSLRPFQFFLSTIMVFVAVRIHFPEKNTCVHLDQVALVVWKETKMKINAFIGTIAVWLRGHAPIVKKMTRLDSMPRWKFVFFFYLRLSRPIRHEQSRDNNVLYLS